MSIESVIPSNHLILCCPLLFLPSIFPSIRVFSNESVLRITWPKYWSFSFSISHSNEHSGLISFRMDLPHHLMVNRWGNSENSDFILGGSKITADGDCSHEIKRRLLLGSFPGGSVVKASAWNTGDLGLIPGSGRSPGEGNGNPLQYSCLENPMEGGAW